MSSPATPPENVAQKKSYADACLELIDGIKDHNILVKATVPKNGIGTAVQFYSQAEGNISELCRRLKLAIAHIRKYSGDRLDDEFADELEAMPE
jgi:hypothetical protein